MKTERFSFASANDQRTLSAICWVPDAPRGVVQIVHGMAEHMVRYDAFAKFLVEHGYAVYGHDHAGHGQSSKPEEYGFFYDQDGWRLAVDDVQALSRIVAQRHPDLPLTLFGHSMGSLMARSYAARYGGTIRALILSGTSGPNPASGLGRWVARVERRRLGPMGKSALLQNLVFSGNDRSVDSPGPARNAWLSREQAEVDKYNADPACGFGFTTTGFFDLLTGLREVSHPAWARRLPKDLPIFIFSGDRDPVGGMGKGVLKVRDMLRDAGLSVTCKLYPQGRHEMLNEENRQAVFEDVLQWLDAITPMG